MAKSRRSPALDQEEKCNRNLARRRTQEHFFQCHNVSSPGKPIQRNAANARERARMRVLSKAFNRLKTSLPWVPSDTKLSKLDTLRLASCYIAHLRKILREDGDDSALVIPSNTRDCTTHPVTLTWPYTLNSRSAYGDCMSVSSSTESNREANDFANAAITNYRNFVPCEYIPMNQPEYHRTEPVGHYLQ